MIPATSSSRNHQVARTLGLIVAGLVLLLAVAALSARLWLHQAMHDSLPQTSGTLQLPGLSAPVHVTRDSRGIPHIIAANVDDLVEAQGFITAQDRLWQMDMLRRHVTGRLAEVLGSAQVEHDRTQRFLQLRETAERTLPAIAPQDRHFLERYAQGVNAEINSAHPLPVEFRVLGYRPEPWTAMDSLLVAYALVEDLSTGYPTKFNREAVEAILNADNTAAPGELAADLYPVGSSHDHPPAQTTAPTGHLQQPELMDDESQASLRSPEHTRSLLHAKDVLSAWIGRALCDACGSGSNNWAVSGTRTHSGKPLVSNDPHLSLTVPSIWYTDDLEAGAFHATGASIPGLPFIVIGHNAHVAWGFTNSYADAQDLYIEQVTGNTFRAADGTTQPLTRQHQTIIVKHGRNIDFDILLTTHGGIPTPILSPLYPDEHRSIALRWNVYDPAASGVPLFQVNSASTGKELVEACSNWGSPAQNLVWGDDSGHIGYHLVGRIPLRGSNGQSGLSAIPIPTGTYEWTGYIPYDHLPQATDPASGFVATGNARITPDDYAYPVSLDWGAPFRNERIWQTLNTSQTGMSIQDMERLQNDTFSALDKTWADRIVYAVDHAQSPSKRARQAADILRKWDGHVLADSAAPNITDVTRRALQPMLLQPHLHDHWKLYTWGESSYAFEQMIVNTPARWLPPDFNNWNDLLTAALEHGLRENHAPADLSTWAWHQTHSLTLTHPVFGATDLLRTLTGVPTTGAAAVNGNAYTVHAFAGRQSASLRFTTDLADVEHSTLSLPSGESGNAASPWYLDQFPHWLAGDAEPLPYSQTSSAAGTLELKP